MSRMYGMMGMRLELGPECKASQARVGIMEWSPDDAGTRRETDKRECKQVASWEMGNHSANVTGRVSLVCMTITRVQYISITNSIHEAKVR